MRWQDLRRSTNIEDRRGVGGFGGGIGIGGGVIVLLASAILGFDPRILLDGGMPVPVEQLRQATNSPAVAQARDFVAVVIGDTEQTWGELFRRDGKT